MWLDWFIIDLNDGKGEIAGDFKSNSREGRGGQEFHLATLFSHDTAGTAKALILVATQSKNAITGHALNIAIITEATNKSSRSSSAKIRTQEDYYF